MKLSIVTINYNNLEGLKKTFSSVFNQTFQDFEYIVIDGGSTDGSRELIEQNSVKINYWISESDKGVYNAMNKGVKVANGEYILFLNSGDYFFNYNVLNDNCIHFKDFDIIYFKSIIEKENNFFYGYVPEKLNFSFFYNSNLNHQTILHKKSLFLKYGYFDESLQITSDWKFLILVLCKHNSSYKFIDEPFTVFVNDGISTKEENKLLICSEREKVLKENFIMFLDVYNKIEEYESISSYFKNSKRIKILKYFKILK